MSSPAPGGSDPGVRVVLATAPDAEVGGRLAQALVGEKLAACVNLVAGVRSIYRWQGKVQDDAEVLLVIKTTEARLPALCARVRALHPYELPELLALPAVGGSADYLAWVAAESRP
jgi:periplasmic divalent cation tolerance protein